MTSNDRLRRRLVVGLHLALATFIPLKLAHAGLGEVESSVDQDRMRLHAQRLVQHRYPYRVHTLQTEDGSRVWQYVGAHGRVFAITWQGMHKPDLFKLLGESSVGYAQASAKSARRGGIQRQFQHKENDVVVQSNAYLHKFWGVAYRSTLLPPGFDLAQLGRE